LKKIPQKDRHLAIASGDIQCAATTVETWISWNANGVATKQIFQLDKSYGADGMAVRNDVAAIKDLKGKTVAASAPGTSPYFALAWMLKRNGLSVKDVTVVNLEPAAAAQAFVSGQNDAAMTYEPYLSTVRAAPDKGKIIATTLDYPIVMDTFGCTPKFLTDNPKAAQALANSYFEALDMIAKDQAKAYEIMGADVKQTGEQFGNSAKYLRWQDKAANQKFFAGDFLSFNKDAAELLLEVGIIKAAPKVALTSAEFRPLERFVPNTKSVQKKSGDFVNRPEPLVIADAQAFAQAYVPTAKDGKPAGTPDFSHDLVLSYSFKNGTSGMSAHFTKVERDGGTLVATVQTNYGTKAAAAPAVIAVARQGVETVEFRDPNGRLLHRDTVK
jgi:NitT/TauT family transport system substrate-binding protein